MAHLVRTWVWFLEPGACWSDSLASMASHKSVRDPVSENKAPGEWRILLTSGLHTETETETQRELYIIKEEKELGAQPCGVKPATRIPHFFLVLLFHSFVTPHQPTDLISTRDHILGHLPGTQKPFSHHNWLGPKVDNSNQGMEHLPNKGKTRYLHQDILLTS